VADDGWGEFVDALAADAKVVDAAVRRIGRLSSYKTTPRADIVDALRAGFAYAVQCLRERDSAAAVAPLDAFERLGDERAHQGVSVGDLLEAFAAATDVMRDALARHVPAGDQRDALLLEASEILRSSSAVAMRAAVAAHRDAELDVAREARLSRGRIVREVLLGDTPGPRQGALESFGIDPTERFYAVRVRRQAAVDLAAIDDWLGVTESGSRQRGLAAFVHGDTAAFVDRLPEETELPVVAGAFGPVPVAQLVDAFRLASRALETARALGVRGCVTFGALGLAPAVLADDDVARALVERYIVPVQGDDRSGAVVLETVERYIESGAQVEATATVLGIHANTVRNRVARFEELTGCSLRQGQDLVEAWWALRRRAMSAPREP
jgi:PucR C-terminal helix-turn-helix domain